MRQRTRQALHIFQPHPDAPMGNCAEAIFLVFEPDESARPAHMREYRRLARGRAPGGVCGAFYAGADILERVRPELSEEFETVFRTQAGCTGCRSIRKRGKAECRECVLAAASYLDAALPH